MPAAEAIASERNITDGVTRRCGREMFNVRNEDNFELR
jgi:ribosomal protein L37E